MTERPSLREYRREAYIRAEENDRRKAAIREARIALEVAHEVLADRRLDGLDQNPRGFRDLIYSALVGLKRECGT